MCGDADEEMLDTRGDRRRAVDPAATDVLEHRGFDAIGAPKPPGANRDALGDLGLDRVARFEGGENLTEKGFEVLRGFVEEHDLRSGEPMLHGIHPAGGAASACPGTG